MNPQHVGPFAKPTRLSRDLAKFQRRMDRQNRKDAQKRAEDAAYAALRKQVYRRDVGCCRVCGAAVKLVTDNPLLLAHLHHVTFRSAGGADTTDNTAIVCPRCHDAVHQHRLDIEGNADHVLTIRRRNLESGRIVHVWESAA